MLEFRARGAWLCCHMEEYESYSICRGTKAHSLYMGKTAFSKLHGDNKELLIVADASHCDLYDNLDKIPFD